MVNDPSDNYIGHSNSRLLCSNQYSINMEPEKPYMHKKFYWVSFISQTGSEIYQISQALGFYPDKIVSSNPDISKLCEGLRCAIDKNEVNFVVLPRPTVQDYFEVIPPNAFVTLNGYLKIIPPEVCDAYKIFNGHPGLITVYPELKGKDPQKKAFELKHPTAGCVIHEVTSELDAGNILRVNADDVPAGISFDSFCKILHEMSVNQWIQFLIGTLL